ncbi:MAG TPA: dephospho-CoA kinase [Gemmataceae bacterium]|nr:dephospho-CoA kinase [Gemmataceae bacterium]
MAKPVVGLIGGIGSGKSTVAQAFARRGAKVIVGDALGHEALRQPAVKAKLVERWGPRVLDETGEVDRRKVAGIVFAKTPGARDELRVLESLVFPWIERRAREEIAAAGGDAGTRLIVLDAAVMLEAGWNNVCDRLVYVHVPREARLKRLAAGRGWDPKEVEEREGAQRSLTEKATRAGDAVDNSGSPAEVQRQVDDLLAQWGLAP